MECLIKKDCILLIYNKVIMIKLLIILLFSPLLGDDGAGYRFVNEIETKEIMDMEMITDYGVGIYNYMSNFSGRIVTEYMGIENGNYMLKQTWSNIIATDRRNDELRINHKAQKLNGTQYIITADSAGEFTREGVDDMAKEMEEANTAFMYFSAQGNILFPLGSDSLRHIGDTWTIHTEKHLDEFPGFESSDTDLIDDITYTFEKIKKKKGKIIAIISGEEKLEMKMTTNTWDESWEMNVGGVFKLKIEYNVTDKKIIKCRLRGNIKGDGIDLLDDSSISFNENMDMLCKIKLK